MWECFENRFANDTSLDPRPLPSLHMRRRCSALSPRTISRSLARSLLDFARTTDQEITPRLGLGQIMGARCIHPGCRVSGFWKKIKNGGRRFTLDWLECQKILKILILIRKLYSYIFCFLWRQSYLATLPGYAAQMHKNF